jgi:hypothetical protein
MHANPMITNIRAKQTANSEIRNVIYPIHEIKTMIVRDKHTCIYSQLEAHCLNALVVQKNPASHIQHHIPKLFLATIDNLCGCVIRTPTLCRSAAPLDENNSSQLTMQRFESIVHESFLCLKVVGVSCVCCTNTPTN